MDRSRNNKMILIAALIIALCVMLSACSTTTTRKTTTQKTIETDNTVEYVISVLNGTNHLTKYKVKAGTTVSYTAEEVANKIFIGWKYEGELVTFDPVYSFTATQDAALNAVYCDEYHIYLNAGEGTVTASSVSVGKGQSYTLPVPTLANSVFDGWSDRSVMFTDEKGKSLDAYSLDADIILYAKFTGIPKYVVTADAGEGAEATEYYEGTSVTVTAVSLTDKICDGWYAMVGEEETELTPNTSYTFTVTKDVNIYAKYHVSYLIKVRHGSGYGQYLPDAECTVVANVLSGKTFQYWRDRSTDEILSYDSTYTFNVTKSMSLEAVYQ